jgi:mannose-1-phosphate guanylyltransferase
VLGGENLIIIDSGDALLICPRDRVQDVRRIVEELKERGRRELV